MAIIMKDYAGLYDEIQNLQPYTTRSKLPTFNLEQKKEVWHDIVDALLVLIALIKSI